MYNKQPSKAAEKAWLTRVANYGCVVTQQSNIQLHHCVGREGKQSKLYIGRWFVLPLAFELHDVSSNHPWNITHHRKTFVEAYAPESWLFSDMCVAMGADTLPFEDEVLQAIMETKR
tara:strand:+ start:432 stop:782 length:351 start_codon:yes stop_codon:yes gene_type:complete